MSQEKQTAEEYAFKKYSIQESLTDFDENYFNGTNVNLAKAFLEGYEYATLKLQEKDKEIERLKGEKSRKDKLFDLANEFAGDEFGHIAVKLHAIHNTIN